MKDASGFYVGQTYENLACAHCGGFYTKVDSELVEYIPMFGEQSCACEAPTPCTQRMSFRVAAVLPEGKR